MNITEKIKRLDVRGRDYPLVRGDVRLILKNVHNGKKTVYESHNVQTHALRDIFAANYGGLLNYQNFEDIYRTYLGGALLFENPLNMSDLDDYGIPARTSNPVVAHAGQTSLTSQADDLTRGNPLDTGVVLQGNSVRLAFEWGTSAGNGNISSIALTHSDVGSYGCGVVSEAQKLLNPFADVGNQSRTYSYGDNPSFIMAINSNVAYNVYLVNETTAHIYKTPINDSKFKLQGGALLPIVAYTTMVTATIPSASLYGVGSFYYHFDFTANTVTLFRVPTEGGTTLLKDVINLDDGTVTSTSITVTGAKLWKFACRGGLGGYKAPVNNPVRAMIYNNRLFVYGYTDDTSTANKIYIVNLDNTGDISEVDTTDFSEFTYNNATRINERFTNLGGIIVHDSYLINGDKSYQVGTNSTSYQSNRLYINSDSISSPCCGAVSMNMLSVCKLYLATKFNLPQVDTKTPSMNMTLEYTLTEI